MNAYSFGDNIKFVNSSDLPNNTFIILTKYRKLIDEKILGSYVKNYIKNIFNVDEYNHTWSNYILYYTNKNEMYIFFKKYYILTIDFDKQLDYTNLIKEIFEKVIWTIKTKNIQLSIDYIFDILHLELEKIEIENFNNIKTTFIEFSIHDNNIIFYIKNNEYNTCQIKSLYNHINNIIYDEYKKIELSKIKIAYCTHDFNLCNNKDYVYTLTTSLFKKGYWLDFIAQHKYSLDCVENNKLRYKTNTHILLHYDIVIYQNSAINNLLNSRCTDEQIKLFQKKRIIVIPDSYSYDIPISSYGKHNLSDILFWDIKRVWHGRSMIEQTNYLRHGKLAYYGIRNIDSIEGYLMCLYYFLLRDVCIKFNKIDMNLTLMNKFNTDIFKPDISQKNDSFLNRTDFFKVNNLDSKKKLVTIFIEWPQAYYEMNEKDDIDSEVTYMERLIYSEKFQNELSQFIKTFENNNCNIIFKIHPSEMVYIIENKLYFVDIKIQNQKNTNIKAQFEGKFKPTLDIYYDKEDYGIKPLIDRYNFVDNSFHNEIMEYTDYGIILTTTTVGWYNYIHNFPIMAISDKKNDWFRYWNNTEEYRRKRNEVIHKNKLSINKNKLFAVGDLFYGQQYYWCDIMKNLDKLIKAFLSKDFKLQYKYFKNHPLYGNTYNSTQVDIADKLIEIISTGKYLNTSKSLNMYINENLMTIYEKKIYYCKAKKS